LLTRLSISFRSSGFPVHAETRRRGNAETKPSPFSTSLFHRVCLYFCASRSPLHAFFPLLMPLSVAVLQDRIIPWYTVAG